ncbi:MAG: DNA repair protein RecO [Christensenellales bacterium]
MPPAEKPADGGKRTVLHGEYVLYQARERTTVVSCQITDSYYPLRVDYERLSHGMYALELCSAAVQPAQENERLFLLLLKSLAYLCYDTVAPRRVTAVFLMGMTSLLGFRPQVGRCAQCGKPIVWMGWRTTITQRISARKRAACSARIAAWAAACG